MVSITFDTLASAKRLKAKGVKSEDTEAFAEELKAANEVDLSHVATREEVQLFKSEMQVDFVALRSDFEVLRRDVQLMESHIINKLGAMLFALAVFIAGCIKYIGH